jgi:hypothetical protein
MDATTNQAQGSLHALFRAGGRSVGWWQLSANLIGALVVTSYFVFIQDAILTELKQFQQGVEPADDITLVIIKIND